MAYKKPDLSFYKVDRASLLDSKPLDKRLSCNFISYPMPEMIYYREANQFVVKNFFTLFEYVTGERPPVLNVNIESNASYCSLTSNHIQVGTKLLTDSRFTQQLKVDAVFAVSIHEMLHKRYTLRDIYNHMDPKDEVEEFSDEYYKLSKEFMVSEGIVKDDQINRLKLSIWNILEDRRIEHLGGQDFPGYIFYFEQLREYALNLHDSPTISNLLIEKMLPIEYLMRMVLMPEIEKDFIDMAVGYCRTLLSVKKGNCVYSQSLQYMRRIKQYVDSHRELVYSEKFYDIVSATQDIYNIFSEKDQKELSSYMNVSNHGFNSIAKEFACPCNEDEYQKYSKEIDVNKLSKEVGEAIERSAGGTGDIETADQTNVSKTEELKFESVHGNTYKYVDMVKPKVVPVEGRILQDAKKYSRDIIRNLGYLSSRMSRNDHTYELNEGELDEDEVYSIGFNNHIFKDDVDKPFVALDLWLLIDESGSMTGAKRDMAVTAALTFILSVLDNEIVNLYVYGHAHREAKKATFQLYEYYNRKKRCNNWKTVFAVGASGGNPDGYAIGKIGELIKQNRSSKRALLIVMSDGIPAGENYSGEEAIRHTHDVVEHLEKDGVSVVQICIANIRDSAKMFKRYIPFENSGKFIKEFVKLLQTEILAIAGSF